MLENNHTVFCSVYNDLGGRHNRCCWAAFVFHNLFMFFYLFWNFILVVSITRCSTYSKFKQKTNIKTQCSKHSKDYNSTSLCFEKLRSNKPKASYSISESDIIRNTTLLLLEVLKSRNDGRVTSSYGSILSEIGRSRMSLMKRLKNMGARQQKHWGTPNSILSEEERYCV